MHFSMEVMLSPWHSMFGDVLGPWSGLENTTLCGEISDISLLDVGASENLHVYLSGILY